MPQIEWVATPNYRPGRSGRKPIAIVNHITAGQFPGCLTWMQNPKAQASAHYLVTKTGRILQLVKDEDTAWHAGGVNRPNWQLYDGSNPNLYTIGIEHEALAGDRITEVQFKATLWLHKQLIAKWGIPIDSDHIIGHYRIDSVNRPNCPGPKFPWERLFLELRSDDMLDNLVIYADGDTGTALVLSQKLGCPMVHKGSAEKYSSVVKHWVGITGSNDNSNYYYAGSNRTETARQALK